MTSTAVTFVVKGVAQPKGNLRTRGYVDKAGEIHTRAYEAGKGARPWMQIVNRAAQDYAGGVYFGKHVAVRIAIAFFLPRPDLPKRFRRPVKKPDIDKLTRAVLDGLKGVVYHDDGQVVDLIVRKAFAMTEPHVRVVVDHAEPLDEITVQEDLFAGLEEIRR